jgi:arylsulfatase
MERDRTELDDLASQHPQRVESMAKQWDAWAVENQVTPLPKSYRVNYLRDD